MTNHLCENAPWEEPGLTLSDPPPGLGRALGEEAVHGVPATRTLVHPWGILLEVCTECGYVSDTGRSLSEC